MSADIDELAYNAQAALSVKDKCKELGLVFCVYIGQPSPYHILLGDGESTIFARDNMDEIDCFLCGIQAAKGYLSNG